MMQLIMRCGSVGTAVDSPRLHFAHVKGAAPRAQAQQAIGEFSLESPLLSYLLPSQSTFCRAARPIRLALSAPQWQC